MQTLWIFILDKKYILNVLCSIVAEKYKQNRNKGTTHVHRGGGGQ